jgi:flagellar basal body P-ring formation protein FlgA
VKGRACWSDGVKKLARKKGHDLHPQKRGGGIGFALISTLRFLNWSSTMKYSAFLVLALLANAPAHSPVLEDIDALDQRLALASGGKAVPLDRRLRLVKCPQSVALDTSSADQIIAHCASLGWRIRVLMGGLIEAKTVTRPVITRGDSVEITYEGDDFDASSSGVALDSGAKGEAIRVKTDTASGTLSAVIVGAGQVQIAH